MSVRDFGETGGGEAVHEVRISGGGLSASFTTYGCVNSDLRLDGLDRRLILGFDSQEGYNRNGAHIGAVAGRFANRISGGRFSIDGTAYQASCNVGGHTTLHSGERGFGRSLWRIEDHGPDFAALSIREEAGHEGFPGAIEALCVFRLKDQTLEMELTANADAPTLCNLAQHNYYNLSGAARIDDHQLRIASDSITPLGADMTPTGEIAAPPEDFAALRRVGDAAVDVNYILAKAPRPEPAFAAELSAGGVSMVMETTAPGVQLYTGDGLAPDPDFAIAGPRAGICLEAQLWPDAANHRHFPNAILRPGETWRQVTRLRFSRS